MLLLRLTDVDNLHDSYLIVNDINDIVSLCYRVGRDDYLLDLLGEVSESSCKQLLAETSRGGLGGGHPPKD